MDDALTDERSNGMTRRPDGWQGTEFSDLQTLQNLLEALLNNGIPVKQHHYNEVILSNRIWPITNQYSYILFTLGPFVTKNGSIFLFLNQKCISKLVKFFFVPEWPKGVFVSILCWQHSR